MILLKFRHATTDTDIYLVKSQIYGFQYNPKLNQNIIYAVGGAICPVKETIEEISIILSKEEEK